MLPVDSSPISGHAVVIGGTGMLSGLSLALARCHAVVTVVARSRSRLASLHRGFEGKINPLPVDYMDNSALAAGLADASRRYGSPDLAVVWMHDRGLSRLSVVAQSLSCRGSRLFLVRGSASVSPAAREHPAVAALKEESPSLLRKIVLGWQVAGATNRWLTHDEISGGVLAAIAADAPEFVVGTVNPWESRP